MSKAKKFREKNKSKILLVGAVVGGTALAVIGYKIGILSCTTKTIKNTIAIKPITLKDLLGDCESAEEIFKCLGKTGNDLVCGITYWFTDINKT